MTADTQLVEPWRGLHKRMVVLAAAIVKERRWGENYGNPVEAEQADEALAKLAIEARAVADALAAALQGRAQEEKRLLQDETQTYDSKGLSRWFASKPNAKQEARLATTRKNQILFFPQGHLFNAEPTVVLDGDFTADELRQILKTLES